MRDAARIEQATEAFYFLFVLRNDITVALFKLVHMVLHQGHFVELLSNWR